MLLDHSPHRILTHRSGSGRLALARTFGIAAVAAFAVSLGTPRASLAEGAPVVSMSPAPISVDHCGVSAGKYSWLRMRFMNTKLVAADEVVFLVQNAYQHRTIAEKGIFSQNIAIDHQFPLALANRGGRNETSCKVVRVHYVDGTSTGPQG
jgi:hypothetical protein